MTLQEHKDYQAKNMGYPNWDEFFNFTCRDGESPVVVGQLIEAAMKRVLETYVSDCIGQQRILIEKGVKQLRIEILEPKF